MTAYFKVTQQALLANWEKADEEKRIDDVVGEPITDDELLGQIGGGRIPSFGSSGWVCSISGDCSLSGWSCNPF